MPGHARSIYLVEEDNFSQQRHHDEACQEPEEPILDLIVTANAGQDCRSQAGGAGDGETSNKRTDGDVHHHVRLAVARCNEKDQAQTSSDDEGAINEKADREKLILELGNSRR